MSRGTLCATAVSAERRAERACGTSRSTMGRTRRTSRHGPRRCRSPYLISVAERSHVAGWAWTRTVYDAPERGRSQRLPARRRLRCDAGDGDWPSCCRGRRVGRPSNRARSRRWRASPGPAGGFACAMFFVTGTDGRLAGGAAFLVKNICLARAWSSTTRSVRHRLTRRADASVARLALGYPGGGLLLAIGTSRSSRCTAASGSTRPRSATVLSADRRAVVVVFTIIPYRGIRDGYGSYGFESRRPGPPSFGRYDHAAGHARLPDDLLFWWADLFFNDGIQTVITAASTYGEKQLGLTSVLIDDLPSVRRLRWSAPVRPAGGLWGTHRNDPWDWRLHGDRRRQRSCCPPDGGAFPRPRGRHRGGLRWHRSAVRFFYSQLDPARREAEYLQPRPGLRTGNRWPATLVSAWCTRSRVYRAADHRLSSRSSGSGSCCSAGSTRPRHRGGGDVAAGRGIQSPPRAGTISWTVTVRRS